MPSRPRERVGELPVEDSWRMVEGEHDSFDTTILPAFPDEDPNIPVSSGQPSSGLPSQFSSQGLSQGPSQGHASIGSQDSIRDFVKHQEDDQVILREPFRPSVPGKFRTPDPQFRMPLVDIDGDRRSSGRSSRTIRPGDAEDDRVRRRGKPSLGSPAKKTSRRGYEDESDAPKSVRDQVAESLPAALYNVLVWTLGVFSLAFRYAQRPLALLLAIYLSFGAFIVAQNMVTRSISVSLSPICRIPGASLFNIPFCPSLDTAVANLTTEPVEFDDLMSVQSQFEQVLEKSADGVSLPFEMKRSETTIRDLRSLVRHSDIQAKDELVLEFDGYIDTARRTAADLQRFNTHVGSAVDAVISINRWTSRYIDSLAPAADEPSPSFLVEWTSWLLHPFQPSDQTFNERILLDKYIEHTALVSDRISGLILEAQAVLRLLTTAEDHLSLIYDISSRSSATVSSRREQVFWNIWTLVGANSAKLHNLSQQLTLLKQVDAQRSSAVAQVSALILELETIQAGLGDLRDRVAEPELLRDRAVIPLSVHIETIDRGVERLEDARRRIRAAENDRVRDALSRGGMRNDERLIEPR